MYIKNDLDGVEDIEIKLLLDAIHDRYGYDLRNYVSTSMRRRVFAALHKSGLDNFGELQHRILVDPAFFSNVLEDLTVRVSSIFRDPDFYQDFRLKVVPILRTYPFLKIWHSGCAMGEEVYATAIMLHEEGLYERSQLYATDLSARAIEQGKQGHYSDKQLQVAAENYKASGGTKDFSEYYTAAYDHGEIKEFLRRNILFFQHNLVSDHGFGEMHVIFCRNVLIYFDDILKSRVLRKFTQSLCPDGFLCLGSSERLFARERNYPFSNFSSDSRIYQYTGVP